MAGSRAGILGLLLALSACERPAEERLRAAEELVFRHDYRGAEQAYESIIIEAPDSGDPEVSATKTRAFLGLAHLRHRFLDDAEGALRAYRAVAELAPGTAQAFEARRDIVFLLRDRLGQAERAVTELSALVEAFPAHPETMPLRLELARLAFRATHYELAEAQARDVARDGAPADRREARLLLGALYALAGREEGALAEYEALLREPLDGPTVARVRFEMGMCLERLGRDRDALAAYERAQDDALDRDVVAARAERVRARVARRRL